MATDKNVFKEAQFTDEDAREWFEAARWPDGPRMPALRFLKHYATNMRGAM